MAKRRRLDAALTAAPETKAADTPPAGRASPPPIAQVAGEASAVSAAQSLVGEVERARAEGRLVISVPLGDITVDHLVRDRLAASAEDPEMDALKASIAAHGQRTPIEVVETGAGFGLISGWRRLAALRALHAETGEGRFARIAALIRRPRDAGEAYIAMIEENEIRVGLSYYERARIAVLAAARGAFDSTEAAVDALYASGSRAKRSKIRSFVGVHEVLGDLLQFPAAIPERLGLRIATAIKAGQGGVLARALVIPAKTPDAEAATLTRALAPVPSGPKGKRIAEGVTVTIRGSGAGRQVVFKGTGVTDTLIEALRKTVLFKDDAPE